MLICKEHVFNAFIITDFPILAAYALGVYLFSKTFKETEYLSKLAEKVPVSLIVALCATEYLSKLAEKVSIIITPQV